MRRSIHQQHAEEHDMSRHPTGLGVMDLDSSLRAKLMFLNIIKALDTLEHIRFQNMLYLLHIVGWGVDNWVEQQAVRHLPMEPGRFIQR